MTTATAHKNGNGTGKIAETVPLNKIDDTTSYTLKSGVVIQLRQVSPMWITQIALTQTDKKPKPPIVMVPTGMNDTPTPTPMETDEWRDEVADWENRQAVLYQKLLFLRGVECEIDLEAVQELREFTRELTGAELDKDDKYVYLSCILIPNLGEQRKITRIIEGNSQPTEEAVEAVRDQFQGNLPG
jgi:hypothetical protein